MATIRWRWVDETPHDAGRNSIARGGMNYYNDNEPFACQWLRNLIQAGRLPQGIVDERSIEELTATDIISSSQVHLFAGIGGWAYALQLAGWPAERPGNAITACEPRTAVGESTRASRTPAITRRRHRLSSTAAREIRPLKRC